MSFQSYYKPNLVEKKIIKYHNKKNNDIKDQEIFNNELKQNHWYNNYLVYISTFIKENYGFVLLFSLIIILLYVRYIEVNKRKKQIQKLNL
jgi:hypothetical protein